MTKQFKIAGSFLILAVLAALAAAPARAQSCSVDYTARVTPAAGVAEPVRGLPFYLLSKSFTEILADADAAEPKPDFDAYVEKLRVSAELKAWMRKNHSVSLSGEEFVRGLTADDIMNVPEFFSAYLERNSTRQHDGFSQAQIQGARQDRKIPRATKSSARNILDAVRKYLTTNTESTAGLDLTLDPINPGPAWALMVARRGPSIQRRALEMAQTHYMVAKSQTGSRWSWPDGEKSRREIIGWARWIFSPWWATRTCAGMFRYRSMPGLTTRVELSNSNGIVPQKPGT